MAIMSGYNGLRAMGDFVAKHRDELLKLFKPRKGILPSYHTITRVLCNIKFEELIFAFYEWAKGYVDINKKECLSI
jgi:hypothetical protein